ncbi:RICIN domain-containing protein [Streptomyces sp. NPDC051366]|uniref:RICIN domain-containing protein n=1 Tax=Streptomyces sp. NPDC051366 TaxID=3365652 RepID=UPI0037BBBA32
MPFPALPPKCGRTCHRPCRRHHHDGTRPGQSRTESRLRVRDPPAPHSGKCLEVGDNRTDNGAPVRLWGCSGQPNQQWRMSLDHTFPGRYFIRNVHSGKCLQIGFLSRVNGSSVNQWDCNGNPNERWSRTDRNPDPIAAERLNQGPALCLDVADWRTDDGTPVQVWSCHGAANQQWVWNLKL